jgi:hypothetical protein
MTNQKIAGFVANLGGKPSLLNCDPAQGLTISIELEGAEPVDVVIRTLREKNWSISYIAAAQSLPNKRVSLEWEILRVGRRCET